MAFRSDITVNFEESPRVFTVAAPSVEASAQDIHDTLTDIEDSIEGAQHDNLIISAGKEDLGGGTLVGITSEYQNIQATFQDRSDILDTAVVTTPDATGMQLTDSASTFITDGVERGDLLVNSTDGSHATILEVVSETVLDTQPLRGGTDNQYDSSDAINIFKIYVCTLSGGNTTAIDDVGASMNPVLQSFGTQIKVAASSSGTLQEQTDIQFASFDGAVHVDVISGISGTEYPAGNTGNPVNNWADAVAINAPLGFNEYSVERSTTLDSAEDYTDASFVGKSIIDTVLTIPAGTTLDKAEFFNVSIEGTLGDVTIMQQCFLGETNTLNDVQGVIEECSIGPAKLTLGGLSSEVVRFVNCRGAGSQFAPPTINCGGDGPEVDIQDYVGQLNIENKTGTAVFEISITGKLILDSTVTNGTIIVNGAGTLEDNSGAGATVINNMIQGIHLQELWKLQGLEFGNPMTATKTARSVQDQSISLALSGDGITTKTVTRQTDQTILFDAPLTASLTDVSDTGASAAFSRADPGTYVDPVTGLIASAAIDAPRFQLAGLLIEEERENLLPQSSEFTSAAGWGNTFGGGCTVTADTTTAPDGTMTADLIARVDADADAKNQNTITLASSTEYTLSCFIKEEAAVISRLMLWDNNTGAALAWLRPRWVAGTPTIDASLNASNIHFEQYADGWWRAMFTATTAGTVTTHQVLINPSMDGSGTNGNYYWGAQLEVGSFASSIIPTSGATVTRSADFLTYNTDAVVLDPAGTVICDITPHYDGSVSNGATIVNVANAQAGPLYLLDDTTQKIAIADGTSVASYDPSLTINDTVTVASRWSGSLMQAIAGGASGAEVAYDGAFARTPGTLYVGSDATGNHINGCIKAIRIYSVDRGETQLLIDTA